MHGIGHPIGVRNQRRVEIDPLHMSDVGYLLHSLRNLFAPLARSAVETRMINTDRSQSRHENAHMGVGGAQRIDEGKIIGDEFVAIVRPVARIGVVDAQMDHRNIGTKLQCGTKFRLIEIGTMAMTQQGRAGFAEVLHLITLAEQALQHHRVGILLAVGHSGTVGNTIPDTGHFDGAACRQGEQKEEKEQRKK